MTRKGQWVYKVCCFFFLFQYLSNVPPHPNSTACCGQSPQLPTPSIHPATMANTMKRGETLLIVFLSIFERDREGNFPLLCFLSFWMRQGGENPPRCVFLCFEHNKEGGNPPRHIFFCFGHDGEENLPSSCFLSFWMRQGGGNPPRPISLCFKHDEEGGTPPCHIFFCFGRDGKGKTPLIVFSYVLNTTRRVFPPPHHIPFCFGCNGEGNLPSSCFLLFWTQRGGGNPLITFSFVLDATGRGNPILVMFSVLNLTGKPSLPHFCVERDGERLPPSPFLPFQTRWGNPLHCTSFVWNAMGGGFPHHLFFHFEHNKEEFPPLIALAVSNTKGRGKLPIVFHFIWEGASLFLSCLF